MDLESKRKILSITAYGIHSQFHKIVEKLVEEELNTKSVFIYEYLLDVPFVRNNLLLDKIDISNPIVLVNEILKDTSNNFILPFIQPKNVNILRDMLNKYVNEKNEEHKEYHLNNLLDILVKQLNNIICKSRLPGNKEVKDPSDIKFIRNNRELLTTFFSDTILPLSNPLSVSHPFLLRILYEGQFIPVVDTSVTNCADFERSIFDFKNIEEFWHNGNDTSSIITDVFKHTDIGKDLFVKWINGKYDKYCDKENGILVGNREYELGYLKNNYLSELKRKLKNDNESYLSLLKEYLLVVYPWMFCSNIKNLNFAAVSISTHNIFYGIIGIVYPSETGNKSKMRILNQGPKTIRKLKHIVKETYTNILLLYENYYEENNLYDELCKLSMVNIVSKEDFLKKISNTEDPLVKYLIGKDHKLNKFISNIKIKSKNNDKCINDILGRINKISEENMLYKNQEFNPLSNNKVNSLYCDDSDLKLFNNKNIIISYFGDSIMKANLVPQWHKYVFLRSVLKKSDDPFEGALFDLWNARRKHLQETKKSDYCLCIKNLIKDNLVFSKYLIASPSIIGSLKEIIKPRNEKVKDSYLPSFLVIGGAGSGKDKMAKIIPLFFPDYRFGERYTINMASLKPSSISAPLISGGNVEFSNGNGNTYDLVFKGIFRKIWEKHLNMYPQKDWNNVKNKGKMPVLILDELNSLDVDAQGTLLRVLENATLQPLGGVDEEKVNFLIIGIVNEPESVLTLHEPLQKFLTDKTIFGGVFGKMFYEYFRNMRRLREDLYFRLIRDGKISIDNLSQRRTDIPLLFSFFLKEELNMGWKKIWIDLDVYEELMRDNIDWSGNFRELQSVAKKVAYNAINCRDNKKRERESKKIKKDNYILHVSYKHISPVMEEIINVEQKLNPDISMTHF